MVSVCSGVQSTKTTPFVGTGIVGSKSNATVGLATDVRITMRAEYPVKSDGSPSVSLHAKLMLSVSPDLASMFVPAIG
jgi:hypothetical protein